MNPYTGHLVDLIGDNARELFEGPTPMAEAMKDRQKALNELAREQGYEPVPPELETAAKKKLAGKDEAHVSLTSGGKLSKWAAQKRKNKRKMAKASRRRNR